VWQRDAQHTNARVPLRLEVWVLCKCSAEAAFALYLESIPHDVVAFIPFPATGRSCGTARGAKEALHQTNNNNISSKRENDKDSSSPKLINVDNSSP
jgi:hypothetical protein